MNILKQAQKQMNKSKTGIALGELLDDKINHNKVFYSKFGVPFKYFKGKLHYSDEKWDSKRKHWEEAYMDGYDLPYIKFLTLEEFLKEKPSYL